VVSLNTKNELVRRKASHHAIDGDPIAVLTNPDRRISDLESLRDRNILAPADIMKDLDLDIDRDTHLHDVVAVQRHGLQDGIRFQNRARWVSNSGVFKEWINSGKSALLFIQGRGSFQRTSPLSFLVSLLYDNIQQQSGTLVLPFFCGRRPEDSEVSGPMAMARAFFAQLLALYETTHVEDTEKHPLMTFLEAQYIMRMKEKEDSLDAYITAIIQLIFELRPTSKAIFVLIDGVDFLDSDWTDEILEFIHRLDIMVRKARKRTRAGAIGGPVKVLLTASTRSRCSTVATKTGILLDVPEDMSGEKNGFEKFVHKV
jgi:hypothetical protein